MAEIRKLRSSGLAPRAAEFIDSELVSASRFWCVSLRNGPSLGDSNSLRVYCLLGDRR